MSNTALAPAQDPERMLEAAEVAEFLNLSLTAVYRLARSGVLESHRHGQGTIRPRGLRFPQSAVVDYLRGARVVPTTSTQEVA